MTQTIRRLLIAIFALSLLAAACGDDDDADVPADGDSTTDTDASDTGDGDTDTADDDTADDDTAESAGDDTGTVVEQGQLDFQATIALSGAAEVPGPGDGGASGQALVEISNDEICVVGKIDGLSSPTTAAHIHSGAADASGDVVVDLSSAVDAEGNLDGCAAADATVIDSILANAAGFYLNVHSEAFAAGAVRGQLA